MFKSRFAPMLALLFIAFFAQSAQAFFDPPWITPTMPTPDETVSVNLHGGLCDAIFEAPGYPQITQEGNTIRLREFGVHYEQGDELCIYTVGTLVVPIGSFPAGTYTLTVDMAYVDGFGMPQILPIGAVPFTVTALPTVAASVPTVGTAALFALLLALSMAAWATRHRSRGLLLILLSCAPFSAHAQAPAQTTNNRTIQLATDRRSWCPYAHASGQLDQFLTALQYAASAGFQREESDRR